MNKTPARSSNVYTVLHIVRGLKRKRNGAGLLQKWDRNAIEISFPVQALARASVAAVLRWVLSGVMVCKICYIFPKSLIRDEKD